MTCIENKNPITNTRRAFRNSTNRRFQGIIRRAHAISKHRVKLVIRGIIRQQSIWCRHVANAKHLIRNIIGKIPRCARGILNFKERKSASARKARREKICAVNSGGYTQSNKAFSLSIGTIQGDRLVQHRSIETQSNSLRISQVNVILLDINKRKIIYL